VGGIVSSERDQNSEGRFMAVWRIRINLPDDPLSRERLSQVLASQRVQAVQLNPRPGGAAGLSCDILLELPRDDSLGEMLAALHSISRQVFVSRADQRLDPPTDRSAVHEDVLLSGL
jgi:hypothetical protein